MTYALILASASIFFAGFGIGVLYSVLRYKQVRPLPNIDKRRLG